MPSGAVETAVYAVYKDDEQKPKGMEARIYVFDE